jgi:hypothetical protein
MGKNREKQEKTGENRNWQTIGRPLADHWQTIGRLAGGRRVLIVESPRMIYISLYCFLFFSARTSAFIP